MGVFSFLLLLCVSAQSFSRNSNGWRGGGQRGLGSAPLRPFALLSPRLPRHSISPLSSSVDGDFSEDTKFLQQEFSALLQPGESKVSYPRFMEWEEIQAILADGLCTQKELDAMWTTAVKSKKESVDFAKFLEINRVLDDMFEYEEEGEAGENGEEGEEGEGRGEMGEEEEEEDDFDVWDPEFRPQDVLEPEFLAHLKQFYDAHATVGLSFEAFAEWDDVRQMLDDGEIDQACLTDLWAETLIETGKNADASVKRGKSIDLDSFLRLNIRLDQVLDEVAEALDGLSDEQVEAYYRKEFEDLTSKSPGAGGLLSYRELMDWPDMREMIGTGIISQEAVDQMWAALPKQPLRQKSKGFGDDADKAREGIAIEAFLALNNAIEDEERSEVISGDLE